MNRLENAAVLTRLAHLLREGGSWCGETHLQKAAYVLKELLEVPIEFNFIFYMHGPFSFDLRDELTAMRADGLLELRAQQYPYGPSLIPTARGMELWEGSGDTIKQYDPYLAFIADALGAKGVAQLERLTTALYVTKHDTVNATPAERVGRVTELKPHVTYTQAEAAIAEADEISALAAKLSTA